MENTITTVAGVLTEGNHFALFVDDGNAVEYLTPKLEKAINKFLGKNVRITMQITVEEL